MSTETATASLRQLITRIHDTHHVYLRTEFPYFEQMIRKIVTNHGKDNPHLVEAQRIILELRDDLMSHLEKEEQILFPYISQLEEARANHSPEPHGCFPSVRFPIRMMHAEHDRAKELLAELRVSTNDYAAPSFACENGRAFFSRLAHLEVDLNEHIRVENEELFTRAIALEES